MKAPFMLGYIESQLHNDRLSQARAKKARAQRLKYREQERLINIIISGCRAQCVKFNKTLIVVED